MSIVNYYASTPKTIDWSSESSIQENVPSNIENLYGVNENNPNVPLCKKLPQKMSLDQVFFPP